jgi:DNA polymerase I-like protein with 3'-5' exonuclease and polymerase domains
MKISNGPLIVIDIETKPASGFEHYEKAALDQHRNEITQIAWAASTGEADCYSGPIAIEHLNRAILDWKARGARFGGHNFKFDLKTLITKGAFLNFNDYNEDSMLQAVANPNKIPVEWLQGYELLRQQTNDKLGKQVHREAGQYSLKTLAPYTLGVEPFWEVDGHDNAEYALTDAKHTLALITKQKELLQDLGADTFYKEKLIPWARMILEAEYRGIAIDLELLEKLKKESAVKAVEANKNLLVAWKAPMRTYYKLKKSALWAEYDQMKSVAVAKAKTAKTKQSAEIRYSKLAGKAKKKMERLNLNSPSQLMWLFRDYYGLDVTTFEGDESTGKSVLNRLASEGRHDIKYFLDYRKHTKLSQAFFPSYKTMQWEGRLFCNFNLNGTRTGRLSSSEPNLQQVPGDLHELFIAGPGRRLITKDLSNIEPILIGYITECPYLCGLLLEGRNFHDTNVKLLFPALEAVPDKDIKKLHTKERNVAKEVGLLLLYGGGPKRIQESAQKHGFTFSFAECKQIYQRFRQAYAKVYEFKQTLDRKLENGEIVKNLMGRPYRIVDRDQVYMKGFNTLIQSSASDLLVESAKRANEAFEAQGIDAYITLLVHDECVINSREDHVVRAEEILLEKMLSYALPTPYGQIKLKAEGHVDATWKK